MGSTLTWIAVIVAIIIVLFLLKVIIGALILALNQDGCGCSVVLVICIIAVILLVWFIVTRIHSLGAPAWVTV